MKSLDLKDLVGHRPTHRRLFPSPEDTLYPNDPDTLTYRKKVRSRLVRAISTVSPGYDHYEIERILASQYIITLKQIVNMLAREDREMVFQ